MTLSGSQKSASTGDDRTREAVDFVYQVLQASGAAEWSLPELLRRLADAFAAQGAGLATSLQERPAVRHIQAGQPAPDGVPWQNQPELLAQVRNTPGAVAVADAEGAAWLLTAVWHHDSEGWLLWLHDSPGRVWSSGESAALTLAGQALARLELAGLRPPAWSRVLERARFQRRLEHAAAVTGRLAHDFGNVLTGILGFAELTLAQVQADSLARQYVNEIYQSAQQGADWVRKLQVFSRRGRPKGSSASLAPAVADAEARLRPQWGGNVTFLVSLAEQLPPVALDAGSLRQLLGELLNNAREAIPQRGVVTLSARAVELDQDSCLELLGNPRPGPHVEITITDTGSGFDPDTRRRLLTDLFHSTKTRHRGLGLPMVHGILHACQGGLRFGPDPEQGTAVRLFVPVAANTEPAAASPLPQRESGPLLAVDDDPLVLELVCRVLERAGYRIKAAPGPAEALDSYVAAREPFRLVISDVLMPVMSGFELARKLRALDARANFLFITSQAPVSVPVGDIVHEFPLLRKPFEPAALVQAVALALATPIPARTATT